MSLNSSYSQTEDLHYSPVNIMPVDGRHQESEASSVDSIHSYPDPANRSFTQPVMVTKLISHNYPLYNPRLVGRLLLELPAAALLQQLLPLPGAGPPPAAAPPPGPRTRPSRPAVRPQRGAPASPPPPVTASTPHQGALLHRVGPMINALNLYFNSTQSYDNSTWTI